MVKEKKGEGGGKGGRKKMEKMERNRGVRLLFWLKNCPFRKKQGKREKEKRKRKEKKKREKKQTIRGGGRKMKGIGGREEGRRPLLPEKKL